MKLIAAFVAALLLVPTAAWADNESKSGWADNESKSGWADDGSTSRRINIQGMITAVDFQRSVIRVQEENGRRWLLLVRAGTEIVFENHNDNDDEGISPRRAWILSKWGTWWGSRVSALVTAGSSRSRC